MSEPVVIEDIRPLIALLIPWVGMVGIIWVGEKRPNLRELFTFVAASIQAAVVLSLVPVILGGAIVEFHIWQIFSYVPMLLRVDGPGLLFACVASILWIATTLYSVGYMRGLHEHAQTRFYSFFALSLSATMGVAFSANLLTIYFFYEMLSVSTFPLVTHMQDKEARTGGRTYLGYLLFNSFLNSFLFFSVFLSSLIFVYPLLSMVKENKAEYPATQVACGWAAVPDTCWE